MIAVALAVVLAGGGGIWAERRWPRRAGDAARLVLRVMLYVLVPPVVFFNLVRLEFDAEVGAGLAVAWLVVLLMGAIAYGLDFSVASGAVAYGTSLVLVAATVAAVVL